MTLTVRSLSVRLGGRQVLHDLDLDASPGQVTAIVGPNGSGKSTLMRVLTGEIAGTGRVTLAGMDPRKAKGWHLAARRGVLPQSATLAFPFTVHQVVRMGQLAGRHAGNVSLPGHALAMVGLAGYGPRPFQDLSGGEQQRAHLARVLAQVWDPVGPEGPNWLLLDEPVSSLDIAHQIEVMSIVSDYARRGGGVVAVMHDLNLTALHADRVAVIAGGRLLASGAPAAVMTDAVLSQAYGCTLQVGAVPRTGIPFVLPHCGTLARAPAAPA